MCFRFSKDVLEKLSVLTVRFLSASSRVSPLPRDEQNIANRVRENFCCFGVWKGFLALGFARSDSV